MEPMRCAVGGGSGGRWFESPGFVKRGEAVRVPDGVGTVGVEALDEADKRGAGASLGNLSRAVSGKFASEVGFGETAALNAENERTVLLPDEGVRRMYPMPGVVG